MALRFVLTVAWSLAPTLAAAGGPDFDRAVAPLLAARCLDCHSGPKPKGGLDLGTRRGAFAGGESGPAVVPGKAAESPLWERVEAGEMPPKKPLTDAEKATLREWLAAGAAWGADPIDPFRFTTDRRAGYDWWALRPVARPEVPGVRGGSRARNPVDRFVLAKLGAAGLSLSPEADRRRLIRRVTFDLIGLPPTPEEVAAFAADADPTAYEKLVDRLLASPHYGERWGRHWLDVARFGESDGFERNAARPNAWPYRDAVIAAFNADVPFDQFARDQIAGDVLRPEAPGAAVATGFLVAGLHNTVLGNDAMRAVARQDELEEVVGAVGQAFLGLTVNCARCHDHKFDPVAQEDYYRLASALGGFEPGEREFYPEDSRREAETVGRKIADEEARLEAIEGPARRAALSERLGRAVEVAGPLPFAAWDFRGGPKALTATTPAMQALGGASFHAEGAVLDGKGAFLKSGPVAADLKAKTLEAWVRLDNLGQRGGGVISLQKPEGAGFDAIVYGENEPGRWSAGSDNFNRTKSFQGEAEGGGKAVALAVTYQGDGTITAYREGKPYGTAYASAGPAAFASGQSTLLIGCRHEPAGGDRMLAGTVVQARLYDRALSAAEVAASAATGGGLVSDAELTARLDGPGRAAWAGSKFRLARLRGEHDAAVRRGRFRSYVAVGTAAPVTRILNRGQVTEPGAVVVPGGVRSVGGVSAEFGLAADSTDAGRRKALAAWVTGPANPLFPRVLVNRLWHHHFGTGLVDTPSDFGFNGGRPSHPELLDWLASELIAGGFHVKPLQRIIVTSAAYRQGSAPDPKAKAVDADDRLLWRFPPRRLEGEAVRDALLAVSGGLSRAVGGKGFSDYREAFLNGTTYFDPFDPEGPEFQRRSVYRFLPRGANQSLLDTLDCPDPAGAAPRRSTTTTPVQALALWNDRFVLRTAEALAARVAEEVPGGGDLTTERRVRRLWQRALQREPTADELGPACDLVNRHGLRALGRAAFNASEFLTVE